MSTLELALNMLAEATTTELTRVHNPNGLEENRAVAKKGGKVAGNARKEIEEQTGKPVITSDNAQALNDVVVGTIEAVAKKIPALIGAERSTSWNPFINQLPNSESSIWQKKLS